MTTTTAFFVALTIACLYVILSRSAVPPATPPVPPRPPTLGERDYARIVFATIDVIVRGTQAAFRRPASRPRG